MKRKNIALAISEIDGYFMNQVARGAAIGAEKADVNLFIFPVKYIGELRKHKNDSKQRYNYQNNVLLNYAGMPSIDALAICATSIAYMSTPERQEGFFEQFKNIPKAFICSEHEGCYSVRFDNAGGWEDGIRYVLDELSRHNIGVVTGPKGHADSDERTEVCRRMAKERGIVLEESRIAYTDVGGVYMENVDALLDRYPDIDALFCVNDTIATDVYKVLQRRGLKIGEDLSVLGYDDKDGIEKYNPPLASVHADAQALGIKAVEVLAEVLDGKDVPMENMIDTTFIMRSSIGRMPDNPPAEIERPDYTSRYFETVRVNRNLCMVFRDMLTFNDVNNIFTDFFRSFDNTMVSDGLLYLLDKAVTHTGETNFCLPSQMHLAACKKDGQICSLAEKTFVPIEDIFRNPYMTDERVTYVVVDVYAKEKQYGIFLCNVPRNYFTATEFIGYQVSVLLELVGYLNDRNKLMEELQYENEQLDSMSYKDDLTGIENRRGFTRNAKMMFDSAWYRGKHAVILYMDLNYLKLINDRYGHADGDLAIQKAACALEYSVSSYIHAVGRIGGDEFAAVALIEQGDGMKLKEAILQYLREYNEESGKDYTVSVSVGVFEFDIIKSTKLPDLMAIADRKLYDEKKNKGPFR